MSIEQLRQEITAVTSASDARAVVNRAMRVAGVPAEGPLERRQLLLVCAALAAEGGVVRQMAELIATSTARPNTAA